jgi:phenylalanyl-tRNA synthetase beta chain
MKLPIKWLKDYIDPKCSLEQLENRMTMAGLEIEHIQGQADNAVLDIEITPNRPDCLNILGLAREVGAIVERKVKYPNIKPLKPINKKYAIEIENKKDCPRDLAIEMDGVNIAASDHFIQERLLAMGCRCINNIVDVTNFLLFEMGQPMHAFDADKIEGQKIIVRRAKKSETITTLDGVTRQLTGDILVIADAKKPIAIAGIMGGQETQVTSSTKRIVLETASFDFGLIRKAARQLGLRTDASYRFERQVDAHQISQAVSRAVALIQQQAQGRMVAKAEINAVKKSLAKPLRLTAADIDELMGQEISIKRGKDILTALGFISRTQGQVLLAKPPSFRADINQKEDLIEEIVRVIGFDRLATSMPLIKTQNVVVDNLFESRRRINATLRAQGLDEIVSYSMVSAKRIELLEGNLKECVKVANPLSNQQEVMRPHLLASMLDVLLHNVNNQQKDLRLFEIGHVFTQKQEKERIGIMMTGKLYQDWRLSRKEQVGWVDLKGVIEQLIPNAEVEYQQKDYPALSQSFDVKVNGKDVGARRCC